MDVRCQHIVDASEPDENGRVSYCYDYDLYRFCADGWTLQARSYRDGAEAVSLMGKETNGSTQDLLAADLSLPLVHAALAYLWQQGKREFAWFDRAAGCYRDFDPRALAAHESET